MDLKTLKNMDSESAYQALMEYTDEKNIDINEPIYTLCVDDIITVVAGRFKNELASGKFTLEDCIYVVKNKMEIQWAEEVEAVINTRLN